MTIAEQNEAMRILDHLVALGAEVRITYQNGGTSDGWHLWEPSAPRDLSRELVRDALGAVDEQWIYIRWAIRENGRVIEITNSGQILFVWGNDPDGSEILADYSGSDKFMDLMEELFPVREY